MHLVPLPEPAQNGDRIFDRGLVYDDRLETALECRVLLDVFVLVERGGADTMQLSARQERLEQVARVHRAFGRTSAYYGMQLVDEQHDLALCVLNALEHRLESFLEFAAVFRAGNECAHVERHDALALQAFRYVTLYDLLRQSFDDRRLADTWRANQHGVVLGAARENLDDPPNLLVPANDRVELAIVGECRRSRPYFSRAS